MNQLPLFGPIVTGLKVIDASALAAILFDEPEAMAVLTMIGDHHLAAPYLMTFELANVCVVKSRRDPLQQAAYLAALALYSSLSVQEYAVDPDGVARLANLTNLTAYDASYLWLARQLGVELVTLDKALIRAIAGN